MQVPIQVGTQALERFITRALDAAQLDKDGDGKVSSAEWGQAVFAILPEIINAKQLTVEVKDLTPEEIFGLVLFAKDNFPNYAGLDDDIEEVVRKTANLIGVSGQALYELIQAIATLRRKAQAKKAAATVSVAAEVDTAGLVANPEGESTEEDELTDEEIAEVDTAGLVANPEGESTEEDELTDEEIAEQKKRPGAQKG